MQESWARCCWLTPVLIVVGVGSNTTVCPWVVDTRRVSYHGSLTNKIGLLCRFCFIVPQLLISSRIDMIVTRVHSFLELVASALLQWFNLGFACYRVPFCSLLILASRKLQRNIFSRALFCDAIFVRFCRHPVSRYIGHRQLTL